MPVVHTPVQSFEIRKELFIEAPVDITFGAVLAEIGPGSVLPDGRAFPMKVEPWPGGRWYRDLGEVGGYTQGNLWGHVQVIKQPTLLELTGPMPMSFPALNHLQYRLTPEGSGTRLVLTHRAMGLLTPDVVENMPGGWEHGLNRAKDLAERNAKRR